MPRLQIKTAIDGLYSDVTSVVVSDSSVARGLGVIGSGHDLVLANTSLAKVATGTYEIEFDEPIEDVGYEWWLKVVAGANHFYVRPLDGMPDLDVGRTKLAVETRTTGDVLQTISGVLLSSVDSSYGVRRTVDLAVVVADATALTESETGVYRYEFSDPDDSVFDGSYDFAIEFSDGGSAYQIEFTWAGDPISSLYSSRKQIEQFFGSRNVEKWSDLNNDQAATEIQDRITLAIADSTQLVNDYLRGGPYDVGFSLPIARQVRQITTMLSGVHLYEARGTIDFDGSGSSSTPAHRLQHHKVEAMRRLDMINNGALRLPEPALSYVPTVQTDDYDRGAYE